VGDDKLIIYTIIQSTKYS